MAKKRSRDVIETTAHCHECGDDIPLLMGGDGLRYLPPAEAPHASLVTATSPLNDTGHELWFCGPQCYSVFLNRVAA